MKLMRKVDSYESDAYVTVACFSKYYLKTFIVILVNLKYRLLFKDMYFNNKEKVGKEKKTLIKNEVQYFCHYAHRAGGNKNLQNFKDSTAS